MATATPPDTRPAAPARSTRRQLVARWLFAASLPVAGIDLASLTAPWCWVGELSLHLSWQAALGLLPGLIAVARDRRRAGFLLVAMLCGCWPWLAAAYQPRAPLAPASADAQGGLVLATGNLFDFNLQRAQALATLLTLEADLLAVQEVLKDDEAVLAAHWPHVVWNHDRELLSSALLSRHPVTWSRIHDLGGFALIEALVATPWGPLRVFVVHLASPKRPLREELRNQQLEVVARLVRASSEPVVIAGDFNLCSASRQWQRLIGDAGLCRPAGPGPSTWPSWLGPFAIDLDHVAGRGVAFAPLQSFVIPGSDHHGLRTRLSLR